MGQKFVLWATLNNVYFQYDNFKADAKIGGISSIIADIGKWVKKSSDEQHFTMTSWNTSILRQLMKVAVFSVSVPKVANGWQIDLMSNIFPWLLRLHPSYGKWWNLWSFRHHRRPWQMGQKFISWATLIYLSMTTFTIPILRQMMELAVFPASSPKLSPGSKVHLISNIYPWVVWI